MNKLAILLFLATIQLRTEAAPNPPRVLLRWTGNSPNCTYNVLRTANQGASHSEVTLVSGLGDSHYIDYAVNRGGKYYYEVIAVDDAGPSSPSNEVFVSIPNE